MPELTPGVCVESVLVATPLCGVRVPSTTGLAMGPPLWRAGQPHSRPQG